MILNEIISIEDQERLRISIGNVIVLLPCRTKYGCVDELIEHILIEFLNTNIEIPNRNKIHEIVDFYKDDVFEKLIIRKLNISLDWNDRLLDIMDEAYNIFEYDLLECDSLNEFTIQLHQHYEN